MQKRFYLFTRDLHLYSGLFISPFVLLFAISVFVLVHPSNRGPSSGGIDTASVGNLSVPPDHKASELAHLVNLRAWTGGAEEAIQDAASGKLLKCIASQ